MTLKWQLSNVTKDLLQKKTNIFVKKMPVWTNNKSKMKTI